MPKASPLILALLLATGADLSLVAIDAARAVDGPDSNWQLGLHSPGMDGTVRAFCEYRGELVVGGTFRTIGTQMIGHVARWDGTVWHALGAGMNGSVSQLAVRGDELVAAGEFTEAGGTPANHVASWNGTAWRPLGDGVDEMPQALVAYRDTLFVGGLFRRAGDLAVKGIARWDGEAWHDGIAMNAEWPDITVTNLAVAGGHLVATYVQRPPSDPEGANIPDEPHPVLWNGAGWVSISGGLWNFPNHLTVLGDSLYAAGYCGFLDGGPTRDGYYVTRWTGTEWLPLGREWGGDPGVPVGHDGALYLARRGTLYRWTGQEWIVASRPQSANFEVLFSGRDGLYSGGARIGDGSQIAHGLARWDGTAWLGVGDQDGWGLNLWQDTRQVLLAAAGDGFTAAGTFLRIGDLQTYGLVQWNGFSWQLLPPGPSPFRANAFLDLGGRLISVADELLGTGSWIRTLEGSGWKNLAWFPGPVLSITPWRNRLVVGGGFAPEHILVAPQVIIDPDLVLQSLGPGLNGEVRATCRFEGSMVASGNFTATTDGGVQLRQAGLWDGTAWQPLADGLPASAITLEAFAGGVAAAMSDGVLHWNGSAWTRLGDTFDGPVQALAVFEGELVAGGAFTHTGSVRLGGLARWREDRWQPIGSGMNGPVQDLFVNGEDLWVSGAFTAAGSVPSSGVAGWQEVRAGVESLHAHVLPDSVTLSWRDPESPTHRSTVVRWSPYGYPADPQDGLPLPFGEDGRFPASPGTVHPFSLTLPFDGGYAFYSVFAVHADGRHSAPGHVQVRLPDRTPPAIALQIRRLADGAPRLAITLHCSEPLVATGVTARLDSTNVRLVRGDNTGALWTGTAEIAGPGSSLLTFCVRDSLGNEACAERGFTAAIARPSTVGRCLVPDGQLLVEWAEDTFATEGLVTVIGEEPVPPTFEVVTHEAPFAPLVLLFRVRSNDPGSDNPRRLGIVVPDGSVQGGVFDAASGQLVIRASASGTYRLVSTEGELSFLADPRFLIVSPAAPNPFRGGTELRIDLRARQHVRVTVHDVGGRTVATLWDGPAGPREETVRWDGRGSASTRDGRALPSGVFFARVQTEHTTRTVRLVKVR